MITLLVYLAIFVILVIVVWYILQQVALPEPLNRILLIVFVVIGAIVLIWLLLQFAGMVGGGGGIELPKVK